MNLPEPRSTTFSSLIHDIEHGLIKIPQFQRDFVWSKEKSGKLLDSIIKGYPIGNFILWKTKEELRALRNIGGINLPHTPRGDYIQYVIDGQQRLTTLFASLKGLNIQKEDRLENYSEFYIDLLAKDDEQIILTSKDNTAPQKVIKLADLLHGKLTYLASFPEPLQEKIQKYKERLNAYQFSIIVVSGAPIDIATEIFTRINIGGKPLTVFEIMVAKTFDIEKDFDLSEKYKELTSELEEVDYESIPEMVVLQTISILLVKKCQKKDILELKKKDIIEIWPKAIDSIKSTIDYFRNSFRIPVSYLIPYAHLIIPFSYYFYTKNKKPTGKIQNYLEDFFWRVAVGGRYSQSLENRLAQDITKIDTIIDGQLPKYDWPVDISDEYIKMNGWFSIGRSFIKGLLCILAFKEPKSFNDNSVVRISNDWLKQANSKNYHHFFPKSTFIKKGIDEKIINHIANITIVDDFLNKREIRTKPPSKYMKIFQRLNPQLSSCMKNHHLIDIEKFGVFEDDYNKFLTKRCKAFSKELSKRIIPQNIDTEEVAVTANQTDQLELE